MHYLSIAEAKAKSGLRLVLTRDVPGPWSESAKAIFRVRNVEYLPVEQHGGRDSPIYFTIFFPSIEGVVSNIIIRSFVYIKILRNIYM